MRDKERIERITKKLQRLWESHQDMRFGQLLYCMLENIPEVHRVNHGMATGLDPFHVEDTTMEIYIDRFIEEIEKGGVKP